LLINKWHVKVACLHIKKAPTKMAYCHSGEYATIEIDKV